MKTRAKNLTVQESAQWDNDSDYRRFVRATSRDCCDMVEIFHAEGHLVDALEPMPWEST